MADEESQIKELFASSGNITPDVVHELLSIVRLLSLDPQELFYKWESYSIKMGDEVKLSMETVRGFKQDVQEALERESRGKIGRQTEKRPTVTATPRAAAGTDVFGMYEDEYRWIYVNGKWLTTHDWLLGWTS